MIQKIYFLMQPYLSRRVVTCTSGHYVNLSVYIVSCGISFATMASATKYNQGTSRYNNKKKLLRLQRNKNWYLRLQQKR